MELSKKKKWAIRIILFWIIFFGIVYLNYSNIINQIIPYVHRSEKIDYPTMKVTDAEFENIATQLQEEFSKNNSSVDKNIQNKAVYEEVAKNLRDKVSTFQRNTGLVHIDRFRKAGIREYKGPETCLQCHNTMKVKNDHGGYDTVNTRANIESSIHFSLNTFEGFNTYGFNGEKVKGIPLGKIDRACGIPGSFTWTGWATIVNTKHGPRSDGCGQCHAGGQYGPFSGTMFPGYKPKTFEFESTDCLMCHSAAYDMNQKYVVQDENGKFRWNQDRSLKAAMASIKPNSDNCLRCHEHNHGGDMYPGNKAAMNLGYKNPRLLHPGAKRGTPTTGIDVHYRAGMNCIDCHETHGHLIARGTAGTDLVSNDLPNVEVTCQKCHSDSPHIQNKNQRAFLNAHTDKLACETCHISHLTDENVVLRDWTEPVFSEEEGVWVYKDILRSGKAGEAIIYKWFNGSGTFMAGALGDNPNGLKKFKAFKTNPDENFKNFDYDSYYEKVFRPIAMRGKSKITPFKRFNAKMYEDMGNQGPFGGMLLPFDYNVYYETGKPVDSVMKAVDDPLIKLMYGNMFKYYMMDKFMYFMGIEKGWTIPFSKKIEPKWMRQDATLMINHSITKEAMNCDSCHTSKEKGVMAFEELGYPESRIKDLRNLEELKLIEKK